MKKTLGSRLKTIFNRKAVDESFFEDLEDALIEADIGGSVTMEVSDRLRERSKKEKFSEESEIKSTLKDILSDCLLTEEIDFTAYPFSVFLVLGVNGVGKTTTIAKMGRIITEKLGEGSVQFAAADTFRAAAIDQLQLHGKRLGIKVVAQEPGSDPGAVVWDAIESTRAKNGKVVLADTAGRMHNKANLVKELQKIDKIVQNRASGAAYKKILIIDSTTGQNGLRQAELFNEAVPIDFAVLTKYDSASKGGIAVSISKQLGIPFAFLGIGEKYEDFVPFSKKKYLDMLIE